MPSKKRPEPHPNQPVETNIPAGKRKAPTIPAGKRKAPTGSEKLPSAASRRKKSNDVAALTPAVPVKNGDEPLHVLMVTSQAHPFAKTGGPTEVTGFTTWRFRGSSRRPRSTIGLGWEVFNLQAMEYWGQISYLKAGINFSERITTVSPNYANEIVTPEMGFGFDGVLSRRRADLVGILNGIDVERWNPAADPFVSARFSAADPHEKQTAKRLCWRP